MALDQHPGISGPGAEFYRQADAFAAVTSGDNSNIVAARVARERFNVPLVVARIFDPRRAEIYRRMGIQTVSSVSWAANEISSLVLFQHIVRDVALGHLLACERGKAGERYILGSENMTLGQILPSSP